MGAGTRVLPARSKDEEQPWQQERRGDTAQRQSPSARCEEWKRLSAQMKIKLGRRVSARSLWHQYEEQWCAHWALLYGGRVANVYFVIHNDDLMRGTWLLGKKKKVELTYLFRVLIGNSGIYEYWCTIQNIF